MNCALLPNPFVDSGLRLGEARCELAAAQRNLSIFRAKAGAGKIKDGGILIQIATKRFLAALDHLWAAQGFENV
jgi:hypothetical protein